MKISCLEANKYSLMHHHTSMVTEKHPSHWPGPIGKQVLLHEVISTNIMVSVTLIIEAFEYVAKNPFLIIERLLGNYTFFLI
jgi:hypothetical protein